MEQMAREIAAIDGNIELGEIQWRTFADGFPNIFVNDAEQLHGRHVAFLASFHNASVIFQQLSVIYSLPKMFVASFRLILPFFPTGTFERVDKEGEIPTAVTMARMLSSIPHSRGGPTDMIVFDIHALQERFYFGDSVTPLFASGIPLLLERLASLEDAADVVIAYPDEGACKRFHNFFAKYDEVVCTKVREGDKRIVTIKEGKPAGKHIVIVDDLVQSGGTLIECAKVLRREGASAVSAYVTHGVFPNESWRRFTDPVRRVRQLLDHRLVSADRQRVQRRRAFRRFEARGLRRARAQHLIESRRDAVRRRHSSSLVASRRVARRDAPRRARALGDADRARSSASSPATRATRRFAPRARATRDVDGRREASAR